MNENISDINALNLNYKNYQQYFDVFAKLEEEQGKYVYLGFNLQSTETFDADFSFENGSVYYSQVILHSSDDFEDGYQFDAFCLYKINGSSFNRVEVRRCSTDEVLLDGFVVIFNYIVRYDRIQFFLTSLLSSNGDLVNYQTFEFTTEPYFNFLAMLTGASSFVRFGVLPNVTIIETNLTVSNFIFDSIINSLNVTSITVMKTAYYAYWEMQQQQILDSLDVGNVESPFTTNLLLINQNINRIINQLSFLPNYISVTLFPLESQVTLDVDVRSFMNQGCPFAYQQTRLIHNYPYSTTGLYPWCHFQAGCVSETILSISTCPTASNLIVPLTINSSLGLLSADVQFNVISAYGSRAIDFIYSLGDSSDFSVSFDTFNMFDFDLGYELVATNIFVPLSYVEVQLYDSSFSYIFNVAGALNGQIRLSSPVTGSRIDSSGQINYGLFFDVSYQLNDNFNIYSYFDTSFVSTSVSRFSPQHINGSLNGFNYSFATSLEYDSYYGVQRNLFLASSLQYAYSYTGNNSLIISSNSEVFNSVAIVQQALPSFVQNDDLSNVEQNLVFLANQVVSLDQRVTTLEELQDQSELGMLDLLGLFSSAFDFAVNLYDKIKYMNKVASVARRALARETKKVESLADDFGKEIKRLGMASDYDPVEAINQGAVYSYQHGLTKAGFRNPESLSHVKIREVSYQHILQNKLDMREMMQIDPSFYLHCQKTIGSSVIFPDSMHLPNHGFGHVVALSTPIEQIPVVGKVAYKVGNVFTNTDSFLTNQYQKYLFHSSVSVRNFEIDSDQRLLYNIRFSGVGEPSIIGPTNAKNPRVKVGYVKVQYEVTPDNTLKLLNWDETKIVGDRTYTAEEVDQLFFSFSGKQSSVMTTNDKWLYIATLTHRRISSRNVIDSIPLPNDIYLKTLDDLTFFSKVGNSFKYNLFSNNCQNFVKVFAQLATSGYSKLSLVASDFAEYVKMFSKNADSYVTDYFKRAANYVISFSDKFVNNVIFKYKHLLV